MNSTSDHTLYARWTANIYTVTFDYNMPNYYENGTPIYFNPVTAQVCDASEAISTTGTKDGCMKWYAFLDDSTNTTINLILDHNTTAYSAWNSSNSKLTPDTAMAQLTNDITNWNATVKSTARLISAAEINQIAPCAFWNTNSWHFSYYLHTGLQSSYKGTISTNNYGWLFDNTKECTTYGCNVEDSATKGYWTSDPTPFWGVSAAWGIYYDGSLMGESMVGSTDYHGIRPVITIEKDLISNSTQTSKKISYESVYGDLPILEKTGYTFNGWYTTGGTKILDTTILKVQENHTLYAQWTANTYTVTFDANGGTSASAVTVTYGKKYGNLPSTTKDGYQFIGWLSNDNETLISNYSLVLINSNQTLTAKWGPIITNPWDTAPGQ